jgi:hypothetical protein
MSSKKSGARRRSREHALRPGHSKLMLPQALPHGQFCALLSARQDKQKPRICVAFVL